MSKMKLVKAILAIFLGVCAMGAQADHRHHSHVGVYFGLGAPAPWYYSPPSYYYYPQRVIVVPPAQPTVYVEQPAPVMTPPPPAPQQVPAYWYYCQSARGYYPYVRECAEAWQPVLPQPPAPR